MALDEAIFDPIRLVLPYSGFMDKLTQELKRIEGHFVQARIEYLHLFNRQGHLLQQLRGKKDKVEIPGHIQLFGTVLTHNHPNDSDLSDKDCYLFLHKGLSEIRAYGKFGVYRLTWADETAKAVVVDIKTIKGLFGKKALIKYGENGAKLVAKLYGLVHEFVPLADNVVAFKPVRPVKSRAQNRAAANKK
jgi:hypothetical protein